MNLMNGEDRSKLVRDLVMGTLEKIKKANPKKNASLKQSVEDALGK